MSITIRELQDGLIKHDKGVLKHGAHTPEEREFCALEFVSIMRDGTVNDNPRFMPDLRPLNDARWSSDQARTDAMLPVLAALWDWTEWSEQRQQRWAAYVASETVKRIVSQLPLLPTDVMQACQNIVTLDDARAAAGAAADAARGAAEAAAWAAAGAAGAAEAAAGAAEAGGAADAARGAAEAAAWAAAGAAGAAASARETPLRELCLIMVEAANQ